MEEGLFQEVKKLINLVEEYKKDIENLSSKKEGFKNVNTHLKLAIKESEEATKKVIDNIIKISSMLSGTIEKLQKIQDENLRKELEKDLKEGIDILTNTLTLLEFQDIMSQRLHKISNFISDVEKEILKIILLFGIQEEQSQERKEELKERLEELEWKKEVTQDDVDDILKKFGL